MKDETFRLALVTDLTPLEVASYLPDHDHPTGPTEQIPGNMGAECHYAYVRIPIAPRQWQHLSDRPADVEISMDHYLCPDQTEVPGRMTRLMIKLYIGSKITAGTFESLDLACFAYWKNRRLVLNGDDWVQRSELGLALRADLTIAEVRFETEDLGHYFHSEFR